MKPLAAIALALATLLALAALYGGRPAAADGPYLPPDPVAVPNTPLPPTPTPEGNITVYSCNHAAVINPPPPQAIWGTVEGRTINLHWSSRGGAPTPLWIEVAFTRAIEGEATYLIRKDVQEFGPVTFVAPYPGPFLAYPRLVYPCSSAGRIIFVDSAPGKTIDGEVPFFFVRE